MESELNPVVKMLEIKIMVEEIEVDGDGREGTDNNQLEAQSRNNVDATMLYPNKLIIIFVKKMVFIMTNKHKVNSTFL
jgi:hypothetical protein